MASAADHIRSAIYMRGLLAEEGLAQVREGLADRDRAFGFGWDLDLTAGWECAMVGPMPILRRMVRGERRPVAGVLCLPANDPPSAAAAGVATMALDHVEVLRPGEWKE